LWRDTSARRQIHHDVARDAAVEWDPMQCNRCSQPRRETPSLARGCWPLAAPMDGVWATPPFLHNGSVPNLYEVLLPAKERTKKFTLGRDFDPAKVGVDTSGKSGTFLVDTSLLGMSNAGHSFENGPRGNGVIGPLLTDKQRWAIVGAFKQRYRNRNRAG
jgi:hypothetical protein